jgi:hypothetical protein
MSKLKCAYMYSTQAHPLPTRKEAEKQFNTKILYGLVKQKKQKASQLQGMHLVEHAFNSVSDMF